MNVQKISLIAILVSLSVATNYALIGVPHVKIMDFIVFIGGFCLGPLAGASIGIFTWAVYGTMNPYGFIPQIWLATMFSEAIYGLAGGLLGTKLVVGSFDDQRFRLGVFLGTTGFILTLIYDLITTAVFALAIEKPIIAAVAFGAPLTVSHELSNAVIFAVGSFPVIEAIGKIVKR
ncbi:MAG: hypothetical protein JSV85_07030 [Candidatus Bathyarchaeota archaeon]|nr:MAG: hypothetical protein JSV85_07030 [Candidatus Bathyarchaeota archaeon]